MISLNNLLLAESFHAKLLCNTDECLSYIIVLLNLLTIFYLVYSSYKKVTKITRIFGYVWSCFIMCASVTILFIHTCIFTMMSTVFSGMAIIAVLSMIFEAKQEEKQGKSQFDFGTTSVDERNKGCYVIYRTSDNKFAFALHAKNKKLLLKSVYKYATLEDAKKAILQCREYGALSELENSTGEWVLDVKHPKFRLYMKQSSYFVDLAVSEEMVLLKSQEIELYGDANWYATNAIKCVNSNVLYFAKGNENVLNGDDFIEEV